MGRTSKVAKTHKSPFSFSSRSKKHFLRFSNRKKKGNARRQGDSIQHPDGFHIVETRDSFAAPFARQVMCWEREKYSVSLQQENRLTETCVCVPPRGSRSISSCDAFLGNSVFHCSSGWFPKRQTKKRKRNPELLSMCAVWNVSWSNWRLMVVKRRRRFLNGLKEEKEKKKRKERDGIKKPLDSGRAVGNNLRNEMASRIW